MTLTSVCRTLDRFATFLDVLANAFEGIAGRQDEGSDDKNGCSFHNDLLCMEIRLSKRPMATNPSNTMPLVNSQRPPITPKRLGACIRLLIRESW